MFCLHNGDNGVAPWSGTASNFTGSTKGVFGYHAGGGLNLDLGSNIFLGAEGRYLWAERSYGGVDIKLNGFTVTGDLTACSFYRAQYNRRPISGSGSRVTPYSIRISPFIPKSTCPSIVQMRW